MTNRENGGDGGNATTKMIRLTNQLDYDSSVVFAASVETRFERAFLRLTYGDAYVNCSVG